MTTYRPVPSGDHFVRLEQSCRFIRWVTHGPSLRYAIVYAYVQQDLAGNLSPEGGIHWAFISRYSGEVERSQGCFYDDDGESYGDGLKAVPRAVRAVRKVMRKRRALCRELGLPHAPITSR